MGAEASITTTSASSGAHPERSTIGSARRFDSKVCSLNDDSTRFARPPRVPQVVQDPAASHIPKREISLHRPSWPFHALESSASLM